ncbi:MAG TPA: hypothetical protein VJ746_13420 [Nitrospira sp.]|nr:hypothetical protein [Nitrospira sp.]
MRFSTTFRLVVLLLATATLSGGCNVVRITFNTPLTQQDVEFIVPGHTTFADVVGKLGAPDALTDSVAGFVATYRFLDMKYSRVNFGVLLRPWSPVDPDLIISRTGMGADALQVLYDSDGIVTQHGFLRHASGPRFNPYPF